MVFSCKNITLVSVIELCFVLFFIYWLLVHFGWYTYTCKTQILILHDLYILYMYCGSLKVQNILEIQIEHLTAEMDSAYLKTHKEDVLHIILR